MEPPIRKSSSTTPKDEFIEVKVYPTLEKRDLVTLYGYSYKTLRRYLSQENVKIPNVSRVLFPKVVEQIIEVLGDPDWERIKLIKRPHIIQKPKKVQLSKRVEN
jgi:hypothetical protein